MGKEHAIKLLSLGVVNFIIIIIITAIAALKGHFLGHCYQSIVFFNRSPDLFWRHFGLVGDLSGGGGSGTKLQTQGRLYCILDFCKSETHHPVFWYLGTIQFWPKICDTHPNLCLNFIIPTQNYVFYFDGLNKTQNL